MLSRFVQSPPWLLLSFFFFCILFSLWPELDLRVTALFYDASADPVFVYLNNPFVEWIYWLFKEMPKVLLPALILLSLLTLFKFCPKWVKDQRKNWYFMLAFLIIGPGLIVHTGFKDNWDRARPRQVVEFGGDKVFTPPLVISDQCDKNCSFVSGHAAMGFAFLALAWVFGQRRWLIPGLVLGLGVGGIRIVMGGHFLSDILFSGYICYFSAWVLARLILGRFSIRSHVA